ncbi:MAG: hypothetical protein E7378_02810 [Clostridiales bacterium]|nr:hypothetical protein [Clostridiales bacterium]
MNNNILSNLLLQSLNGSANTQSLNNNQNNTLNNSDYPECFFTNNNVKTSNFSASQSVLADQSQKFAQPIFSGLFSRLLPMLLGGGISSDKNKIDFASILSSINPNLSQIISSLSKKKEKTEEKEQDKKQTDTKIDMSEFVEIS